MAPTAVLLYHRVAAPRRDTHRLCVHPDRFEAHVEHLRRHERVVPLDAARRPARRRRVVVTFDDGYADNALAARPVLEEAHVPATVFVTAGFVGSAGGAWWDELEQLVLDGRPRVPLLRVDLGDRELVADVRTDVARARAHLALHRRLVAHGRERIDDVMGQLRTQLDPPASDGIARFVSPDELRSLAASAVVEVGSHGLTHRQLATLDPAEQRRELVTSRETLQTMTGRAVTSVAYPFGGPGTFDATTERLAAEAGYALGCANRPGLVRPWTPRYRLPRLVVRDWEVDELAGRLDAWSGG